VLLYILAGVAVLILLNLLLKWLATQPAKYRDVTTPILRYLLREVYVRGFDGGYLHIDLRRSSTYFRVYKTIVSQGVVHLAMRVPPATQAVVGLGTVEQALSKNGFHDLMTRGAVSHDKNGNLVIDCGTGIAQATVIVEFLLRQAFHAEQKGDCVAYGGNCHPDPRAHPGFDTAPLP
jgi:hypothetical protein